MAMGAAVQLSRQPTVRAYLRSGAPALHRQLSDIALSDFSAQWRHTCAGRTIDANSIAGKTTGFELDQAQTHPKL
jgi:hypothetical protein